MGLHNDNGGPVAADRVLQAVSQELRAIADMSEQLQFDISEVLKDYRGETPIRVYQLQNLDLITQTIDGLAEFTGRLAQSAPSEPGLDAAAAAKAVRLADLAKRLADCESAHTDEPDYQEAGKCSFF